MSSGWEALPGSVNYNNSGFTHNLPITRKHSSYPASQSTGYHNSYIYVPESFGSNRFRMSRNSKKEDSGFTLASNVTEPITYRPAENHSGSMPGEFTWRPTGCSVMSQDFFHPIRLAGLESVPVLSGGPDTSKQFTQGHRSPVNVQQIQTQVTQQFSLLLCLKKIINAWNITRKKCS